jgi:hypothetical protein
MGVTPLRIASVGAGRHRLVLKLKHTPAFDTIVNLKTGIQSFKFRMVGRPAARLAATPEE